jgi:hypothetical protein
MFETIIPTEPSVIAFIAIRKIDVHPVVFIGISAVVGIVVGF